MKQLDNLDMGSKNDVAKHRLEVAKEDLLAARVLLEAEIFPREWGRKIVKAEEIRHASDYDTFYIASKEETVQQIKTAEKLIEAVRGYLEGENKEND